MKEVIAGSKACIIYLSSVKSPCPGEEVGQLTQVNNAVFQSLGAGTSTSSIDLEAVDDVYEIGMDFWMMWAYWREGACIESGCCMLLVGLLRM